MAPLRVQLTRTPHACALTASPWDDQLRPPPAPYPSHFPRHVLVCIDFPCALAIRAVLCLCAGADTFGLLVRALACVSLTPFHPRNAPLPLSAVHVLYCGVAASAAPMSGCMPCCRPRSRSRPLHVCFAHDSRTLMPLYSVVCPDLISDEASLLGGLGAIDVKLSVFAMFRGNPDRLFCSLISIPSPTVWLPIAHVAVFCLALVCFLCV